MKSDELELQHKRVEQGRKLTSQLTCLNVQYNSIRNSNAFTLYVNRNGAISQISYGHERVNAGWEFEGLSKKEIEELMDAIRQKILEQLSIKMTALQSEFDKL